jgi:hypothetical protein
MPADYLIEGFVVLDVADLVLLVLPLSPADCGQKFAGL